MPIPKILCSNFKVKSNCEHKIDGPNRSSAVELQAVAIALKKLFINFEADV
jgi:hypothetical protein